MSVLSWLKDVILPEPPPPKIAPLRTARHPLSDAAEARVVGPDEDLQALEQQVYEESARNKVAALKSLSVSHVAISAEERSRHVLDELMRSMDRGNSK